MLAIPTYFQMTKVMFYDTLQQLCDKKNQMQFNKEVFKEDAKKSEVIRHFGGKSPSEFDLLSHYSTRIDFDKTVRNMGRLNPRIKLMTDLQKSFRDVYGKYAVFADSEANLHITDAERRAMNEKELRRKNLTN